MTQVQLRSPCHPEAKIRALLVHSEGSFAEYREIDGFECGHCGAEWDREGEPRWAPEEYTGWGDP